MKAIILAAGKGTRLGDLTIETNKILLPIGDKKIIEYVLDNLSSSKILTDVFIAVSHNSEAIKKYIENTTSKRKLKIHIINTLGWETGGDLKTVMYETGIYKEPESFLICYGDVLTKINVDELIDFHKKISDKSVTVTLFPVSFEEKSRFGIAEIDKNNIVTRFMEKPEFPEEIKSNMANAGYIIAERSLFNLIPYGKIKLESKIFPILVNRKSLVGYITTLPYWIDIGTPESYIKAYTFICQNRGVIPP